jgi:hypothetical protein
MACYNISSGYMEKIAAKFAVAAMREVTDLAFVEYKCEVFKS